MKIKVFTIILIFILIPLTPAFAIDKVCEQVLEAGEVRANQLAWHSKTELKKNFVVEAMKVNGKFYSKQNDAPWKKATTDFDAAARNFASQARSGAITISQCKDEGTESIDGIDVTVITYQIEMIGSKSANGKIYIGEDDGLPYMQSSDAVESHVSYKDITEP